MEDIFKEIFSDIKAMIEVQKIKDGKTTTNLSISQITGLITNMSDARKNLSEEKFKEVYNLFIKKFDAIAPYEKYSGGNELEFSFLIKDIRKQKYNQIEEKEEFTKEELNYINYLVNNSKEIIDIDDAKDFIYVLQVYGILGKDKALAEFDLLVKKFIKTIGPIYTTSKMSFLLGVLNSNGIVDKVEMNNLLNKYQKQLIDLMMENNK